MKYGLSPMVLLLAAGAAAQDAEVNVTGSSAQITDEFSYSHLRALWKVGLAYRPRNELSLGVAVTTPGVGIYGIGKVDVQDAILASRSHRIGEPVFVEVDPGTLRPRCAIRSSNTHSPPGISPT